ncbi:hypothetical protein BDP81DRAFT_183908 [Colletotrichum phormii]|uniref:Secreted protein n=1 Tax=Colletotrichum phormii TaxID=359342 RepID=A0AAJ0EGX0_9PEZI|nr:uncharacterized protein BDP81DRAFT_183908 [Colletotrichum phormii]KAK1639802.1 hypothetical protein BDP81DRAFT_183908 [Colletotrichum phormii]
MFLCVPLYPLLIPLISFSVGTRSPSILVLQPIQLLTHLCTQYPLIPTSEGIPVDFGTRKGKVRKESTRKSISNLRPPKNMASISKIALLLLARLEECRCEAGKVLQAHFLVP